jgi:hypothetical protein
MESALWSWKGCGFITREDETGCVQLVRLLHLADSIHRLLAESRLLTVSGRIEGSGDHITLLTQALGVVPPAISPAPRDGGRTVRLRGKDVKA